MKHFKILLIVTRFYIKNKIMACFLLPLQIIDF